MAELDTFKAALFIGGFLLFSSLQYLFPYTNTPKNSRTRTLANLGLFALNLLVTAYFVNILTAWGSSQASYTLSFVVFAFLLLDMVLYFWHRLNHTVPFLWRFHQVHHLDNHLSTSTAFRFHPVEIALSPLFKVGFVWIFNLPWEIIVIHSAVVNFFSMYEHSNFSLPNRLEKPVRHIFITPDLHKTHHHPTRKNTDSNYGTIFSVWDRLFGTFNNTKHDGKYGIKGQKCENHFLKLLLTPFQK